MSPEELKPGSLLTVHGDIISIGGQIIMEMRQRVIVDEVVIKPAYRGFRSGLFYKEEVIGVKLKGFPNTTWELETFNEFNQTDKSEV